MSDTLDELVRMKIEAAGAPAEACDILATLLRSTLNVQADGIVKVLDGTGNVRIGAGPAYADMTLDEAVAEMAASKPTIFGRHAPKSAPAAPPPEKETVTARVAREAQERREAPPAQPSEVNPWKPETASKTMQVAIAAKDPVKAARLRREAGIN